MMTSHLAWQAYAGSGMDATAAVIVHEDTWRIGCTGEFMRLVIHWFGDFHSHRGEWWLMMLDIWLISGSYLAHNGFWVSIVMGVPLNGWFISWKILKWMIWRYPCRCNNGGIKRDIQPYLIHVYPCILPYNEACNEIQWDISSGRRGIQAIIKFDGMCDVDVFLCIVK